MKLTTSNGKTFDVDSAFGPISTGDMVIRLHDHRRLPEIASDFDGCDQFHRESETEGNMDFDGYTALTAISRDTRSGRVTLTLEKEA